MPQERGSFSITDHLELQYKISKQVDRLLLLGFHRELGKSEDDYRADFSLPEDAQKPLGWQKFRVRLVTDPRVSLRRACELAAGGTNIGLEAIDVPDGYAEEIVNSTEFPADQPYMVITHNGQRYRPIPVAVAEKEFQDSEVGSPLIEIVHSYLQYPRNFRDHGHDAAGSTLEHFIPWLARFNKEVGPRSEGKITIGACGRWDENSYWGAVTRSREMILLGPS